MIPPVECVSVWPASAGLWVAGAGSADGTSVTKKPTARLLIFIFLTVLLFSSAWQHGIAAPSTTS